MEDSAKEKLKLNDGEELKQKNHRMKGSLQETDIYSYDVVDSKGVKVGMVQYTHHTAIKGFKVSQSITQKTLDGTVLIDERW